MTLHKQLALIAYDTPCSKRRRLLAKIACEATDRVQKSVYEGWLASSQRIVTWERLMAIADPELDELRCYWICERCRRSGLVLGKPAPNKATQSWLF
ncbi:CRISPR-associated endonuclease Cas2 [Botrimarina hoheduenensis]|uniref:CRISPR-associated endonuclease Cas2 n=1 Tax=Botrimarina hoheduenensis TaxID=2528000 RepID=UPI0011B58E00